MILMLLGKKTTINIFFSLDFCVCCKFRKISVGPVAAATAVTAGKPGVSGNENDNANRITYDEFAILVRRIDRMEYSIGNIVSRVNKRLIN